MKRALVILNPGARSGRGRRRWRFWRDGLERSALACRFVESASLAQARELAASADEDIVVAAGGDGTINAALNGLVPRGPSAPALAVLYAGTSPDFCRFHGIPIDPEGGLRTLLSGEARRRDAGRVRYADGTEAWFGCSTNLGIGAVVAARANRWRRFLGDRAGTGLAVVTALFRRHADLRVAIDGDQPVDLPRCCHLCIAKSPWIASGLRFTSDMHPDDGRLAVLAVAGRSAFGLLRLLPSFYTGAVSRRPGVLLRLARSVAVAGAGAVEYDGDPHGTLPITVDVAPGAIRLLVPRQT